jgi:hypothetical protein
MTDAPELPVPPSSKPLGETDKPPRRLEILEEPDKSGYRGAKPVIQIDEDRAEWERHKEDMRSLTQELGNVEVTKPPISDTVCGKGESASAITVSSPLPTTISSTKPITLEPPIELCTPPRPERRPPLPLPTPSHNPPPHPPRKTRPSRPLRTTNPLQPTTTTTTTNTNPTSSPLCRRHISSSRRSHRPHARPPLRPRHNGMGRPQTRNPKGQRLGLPNRRRCHRQRDRHP